MIAVDEDHERPPSGLTGRQYRTHNAALRCAVLGCTHSRDWLGPLCRAHRRRFISHGSLTKDNVPARHQGDRKRKVAAVLDTPTNRVHPEVVRAMQGLRRLLYDTPKVHQKSEYEYLRRLSAARAEPREILIEVTALCLWLYRHDQEGLYGDPDYLAVQTTRRLLKLAPPKYTHGGEARTMKRTRAAAREVLEIIGPLVALLISTIERARRKRATRNRRNDNE